MLSSPYITTPPHKTFDKFYYIYPHYVLKINILFKLAINRKFLTNNIVQDYEFMNDAKAM
jgi:hypothetical protein